MTIGELKAMLSDLPDTHEIYVLAADTGEAFEIEDAAGYWDNSRGDHAMLTINVGA